MCVGGYCVHTYTQVYIDLKGYYMSSGNGRWGEWAFSDLEMKRERSKEKRDGEDIEYDHVASITAIYTIRIVGTSNGNRRRRFLPQGLLCHCVSVGLLRNSFTFYSKHEFCFHFPSLLSIPTMLNSTSAVAASWCSSGQLSIHWTRDVSWHCSTHT